MVIRMNLTSTKFHYHSGFQTKGSVVQNPNPRRRRDLVLLNLLPFARSPACLTGFNSSRMLYAIIVVCPPVLRQTVGLGTTYFAKLRNP